MEISFLNGDHVELAKKLNMTNNTNNILIGRFALSLHLLV